VFDEQGRELVTVVMSEKPRFNKVGYQERQGRHRYKRIWRNNW